VSVIVSTQQQLSNEVKLDGAQVLKSTFLIAALVGGISTHSFCQFSPLTLSSPNQELSLQFATVPVKGRSLVEASWSIR
jgi:hypothetical protein